jgi:hypothetical protein
MISMGKTSATTRRRRKTNADPTAKPSSNATKTKVSKKSPTQDEFSLPEWRDFANHPVAWVLVLIAIPYGLNLFWRRTILQTTMLSSRPPVARSDERQVLVLGSLMAFDGYSQNARNHYENNMATTLTRELGLEIGYQNSDSSWNFVRDGTVSWIHGLRYFDRIGKISTNSSNGSTDLAFEEKVLHLCRLKWALTYDSRDRYGFEQTVFGSDADFNNCSFLNPDSRRCQLPVCEAAIKKEYGCALNSNTEEEEHTTCDMMPFRTTLLQTRQPWHIVQSMVGRYCWKKEAVQENMPSSLEALLTALEMIPAIDPGGDNTIDDSVADSSNNDNDNSTASIVPKAGHCVNQFIDYVTGYYNTLLDNSNNATSTSNRSSNNMVKIFKIEEASPCEVAELAGLLDPETTVYAPNHEKIKRKCAALELSSDALDARTDVATAGKGATLSFEGDEDLEAISVKRHLVPHATAEHLERMQQIFERLGYEYRAE